jgi:hypothetical protein
MLSLAVHSALGPLSSLGVLQDLPKQLDRLFAEFGFHDYLALY